MTQRHMLARSRSFCRESPSRDKTTPDIVDQRSKRSTSCVTFVGNVLVFTLGPKVFFSPFCPSQATPHRCVTIVTADRNTVHGLAPLRGDGKIFRFCECARPGVWCSTLNWRTPLLRVRKYHQRLFSQLFIRCVHTCV